MKKRSFYILSILFTTLLPSLNIHAEANIDTQKNMSITLNGSGMVVPMAALLWRGGLQFERAISPTVSVIVPVQYGFSGIMNHSLHHRIMGGFGVRYYFFKRADSLIELRGFYFETHLGLGYVLEKPSSDFHDDRKLPNNHGFAFGLFPAFGYSYAFDSGFTLGANLSLPLGGYTSPVKNKGILPIPELGAQIGWAF